MDGAISLSASRKPDYAHSAKRKYALQICETKNDVLLSVASAEKKSS